LFSLRKTGHAVYVSFARPVSLGLLLEAHSIMTTFYFLKLPSNTIPIYLEICFHWYAEQLLKKIVNKIDKYGIMLKLNQVVKKS
jgi:hypothetical protein